MAPIAWDAEGQFVKGKTDEAQTINQVTDLQMKEIKPAIAGDFEHFLVTHEKGCNNTAMKYIRILKQVIETVSQLLGHRSIRTTQIYAKVSQKEVSQNMKALKEKLAGLKGEVKEGKG